MRLHALLASIALGVALCCPARAEEQAELERPFSLDPFAPPRNAHFYSGLGQPLLRAAALPAPGTLGVELRGGGTKTTFGARNRFDGVFWEYARVELALVPLDWLEVWAAARISGWDERRDVFRVAGVDPDSLVVEGELEKATRGTATSRHENLSEVSVGLQVIPVRTDWLALGAGLQVKSPGFRRKDLTNSGTTDLAPFLSASIDLGPRLRLHLNAGAVIPLGRNWIAQDRAFELRPFFSGAVGITWAATDWLSLGATLEGSSQAFEDVPLLGHGPIAGSVGARLSLGRFELELGVGTGLSSHSADFLFWIEAGWRSRPLWSGD